MLILEGEALEGEALLFLASLILRSEAKRRKGSARTLCEASRSVVLQLNRAKIGDWKLKESSEARFISTWKSTILPI